MEDFKNSPITVYYRGNIVTYGTPEWPLQGRPFPGIKEWGWFGEQLIVKSPDKRMTIIEPTESPIHVLFSGTFLTTVCLMYYNFNEILEDLEYEGLNDLIPFVKDVEEKCKSGNEYYTKALDLKEIRVRNAKMRNDAQREYYSSRERRVSESGH